MSKKGFTLIEVLITLILASLLAAMVAPFMLSGVTHAPDALHHHEHPAFPAKHHGQHHC